MLRPHIKCLKFEYTETVHRLLGWILHAVAENKEKQYFDVQVGLVSILLKLHTLPPHGF